jgi:DNA-binding LytR/AlgR family response regulator
VNIGICDDNTIYLKYLSETVNNLFITQDYRIQALNPDELVERIQNHICPYEILITDIDMGIYNGIDLAEKINKINPSCIIIFISSYLNYATKVYDVDHIYFVLKNEITERLPKALEKAITIIHERLDNFLTIRYQNVESRICIDYITHLEAMGRYLYIHDTKDSYKTINSLKVISTELPDCFIRCHNSYIVNLKYVRSICRTSCVLTSGETIPISQTYYKSFHDSYIKFISKKLC